jgi:hypothetical protein
MFFAIWGCFQTMGRQVEGPSFRYIELERSGCGWEHPLSTKTVAVRCTEVMSPPRSAQLALVVHRGALAPPRTGSRQRASGGTCHDGGVAGLMSVLIFESERKYLDKPSLVCNIFPLFLELGFFVLIWYCCDYKWLILGKRTWCFVKGGNGVWCSVV